MAAKSSKVERSFGLGKDDVAALVAEHKGTKRFPNPHNKGCYKFTIDALVTLGANKWHPLNDVFAAYAKAAGTEWFKAWKGKDARNEKTGKSVAEKFVQNLTVLQRVNDYGLRLLETGKKVIKSKGAVVDMQHGKDGLEVRLNLDSAKPIKAGRKPTPAASKPTPKAKAAKGKASKKAA